MSIPDHPARVVVDLAAISSNVAELKRRAGDAEVMAVVKADAYGHGLVPSATAALAGGATWLGVAQLAEAHALRAAGLTVPVLSWLHAPGMDFTSALHEGITLSASAPWALSALAEAAHATGRTATVHLKVDTGLGRNGAFQGTVGQRHTDWQVLVALAARLQAEGSVDVEGVFTHFAYADAPEHPTVLAQQEAFAAAVAEAEAAGLPVRLRHMANSAAVLTNPASAWDLVRPGVAVYGLTPAPEIGSSADFGLTPAMTATARASVVKRVPAGQGVSYGHTYRTSRETTLVDVPLGYADGVPRHASWRPDGGAEVLVGGVRCPVAGRVCMDQFVVDAGDLPVSAGDEVVLFGPGHQGEPTATDWAQAAGTINYEVVTRFGPRVPREYVGAPVAEAAR